jgi:hypothetical protein
MRLEEESGPARPLDAVALLREQLRWAHEALDEAIAGLTREEAHRHPAGEARPIGATYARALISEDAVVNALLQPGAPLFATSWDNKVGVSDCMPLPGPYWPDFEWPEYSYDRWALQVRVSLPMVRKYARGVRTASDDYLASLTPAALDRKVHFSATGQGEVTVAWVISRLVLGELDKARGEIKSLRAAQMPSA